MYDPRLPSLTNIIKRHWRTMKQDPYLATVFPVPPMVAYKRPPNLKDKLIRAKVPKQEPSRPKRNLVGIKKCNSCPICPYIEVGKTVKATQSNFSIDINASVNCQTRNLVYKVGCKKCPQQYIGQTYRTLQDRFSEHLGYIRNNVKNKATGEHFNQKGHSISDIIITIIEKVHNPSKQFREQRERMYINNFNTKYKGMNLKT